jgi:hypothetical protein
MCLIVCESNQMLKIETVQFFRNQNVAKLSELRQSTEIQTLGCVIWFYCFFNIHNSKKVFYLIACHW